MTFNEHGQELAQPTPANHMISYPGYAYSAEGFADFRGWKQNFLCRKTDGVDNSSLGQLEPAPVNRTT